MYLNSILFLNELVAIKSTRSAGNPLLFVTVESSSFPMYCTCFFSFMWAILSPPQKCGKNGPQFFRREDASPKGMLLLGCFPVVEITIGFNITFVIVKAKQPLSFFLCKVFCHPCLGANHNGFVDFTITGIFESTIYLGSFELIAIFNITIVINKDFFLIY